MQRFGIAPKFSGIAAVYGIPAGWLTYRHPDVFVIRSIPYWGLAGFAAGLLVAGTAVYVKSLRAFNVAYREGRLVTEGPFAVVRHPIYAAWILLIIPGVALFFRSWLLLPVPLVAYVAFKVFIHEEDDCLRRRFGQSYLEYRFGVGELFPRFHGKQ